jgi:hypothetical protein
VRRLKRTKPADPTRQKSIAKVITGRTFR